MTILLRATIVGINEYQDKSKTTRDKWLKFARADAEEMGAVLHQSKTFFVEKLDLLTDKYATEGAIRTSLAHTFETRRRSSETIALFYFAGHGAPHPLDDRIILCCHDVDHRNPNRGGIRLNDIYDLLLNSSADCNIAIIDACFSGDIINVDNVKRIYHTSPAEQAKKAIESLQGRNDKTIAIFAACRSNEASREDAERQHGIYTDEILKGWRDGLARDNNGMVSLLGLADYLSQRFAKDGQIPQFSIRTAGQIVLWKGDAPTPDTPLAPVVALPPPSALTVMKGGVVIPTFIQDVVNPNKRKQQALVIASIVVALLACGIATVALPALSSIFFGAVFIWGILLAILMFLISPFWSIPFVLAQGALLVGFGYIHFSWRIQAIGPALLWLAGFQPLFWVVIGIETLLLGMLVLSGLMR